MDFTMMVVIGGVALPLAAMAGAEAARRFGGRRARRELRVRQTRERATYNARYRANYCRQEARTMLCEAQAARLAATWTPNLEADVAPAGIGGQTEAALKEVRENVKGLI